MHTAPTGSGRMPGGGPGRSATAPQTVADQVLKLRGHFGLERVMSVGDRGLPVQVRIKRLNRHPGLNERVVRAAGALAGRDPMNWRTVSIVCASLTGRSRGP